MLWKCPWGQFESGFTAGAAIRLRRAGRRRSCSELKRGERAVCLYNLWAVLLYVRGTVDYDPNWESAAQAVAASAEPAQSSRIARS